MKRKPLETSAKPTRRTKNKGQWKSDESGNPGTQWRPGESGNISGRPKGALDKDVAQLHSLFSLYRESEAKDIFRCCLNGLTPERLCPRDTWDQMNLEQKCGELKRRDDRFRWALGLIAKTFPKELRAEVLEIENRRSVHRQLREGETNTSDKIIDIRRRMESQKVQNG